MPSSRTTARRMRRDSAPNAPAWDPPIHIPGAVSFSPEPQSGEYAFDADDEVYYQTLESDNYAGNLEMAKIPDSVLAQMFGWVLDKLGGLLQVQGGKKRSFALMGETSGNVHGRRFVYYNTTASIPAENASTKTRPVAVQTQTMAVAMNPIALDEKRTATRFTIPYDPTVPGNAEVYDNFFNEVYVPPVDEETEPEVPEP